MFNGFGRKIKIGFPLNHISSWMGGVNYLKNLLIAISMVSRPKIVPYIEPCTDEKIKFLYQYAHTFRSKKTFQYELEERFPILRKMGWYAKQQYHTDSFATMDIISHSYSCLEQKFLAWIPDFQHLRLPEMFSEAERFERTNTFRALAQAGRLIIVSSEDALDDYKKFVPEFAKKARVLNFVAIPPQDVYRKTNIIQTTMIQKYGLTPKYFYLPNQFWKHKNHRIVFEALSLLKQEGIDVKVVLTGATSDYRHIHYFQELMNFIQEKNIQDNVKLLGLIDTVEVYYLMRNCISIINPSLFEGWSSTVEEAKSIGKNIILSNIPVHQEQNPPEGIYFDPYNPQELATILKCQWETKKSQPNFTLEQNARKQMKSRILAFGKKYQQIILEALEI